ncbi:P-loop containing nucleoside triphosphate hydrolases superfamily protein isoform 2 [Tripterygium wilfordii]|uniref:GPN-loop GTPase n=1 Tax=Tripterygium wilfordii TaxID=458696 RepID=A0A7J7CSJ0_TRIWF|nr:P-loop containing nucleoside triphosphate hydrolases superfamily protein isoform 2 [Tripterygium wilfordii]
MSANPDVHNLNMKSAEEGTSMQVDYEDALESKENGKANDEIIESMEKMHMESPTNFKRKPVIIIVIEMAGSGKTTFLHRLFCDVQASNLRGYVVNLDPAVMTLPFGANIDIRDTVRYKEVMKQFNLGPNGGILTCLELI